MVLYNVTYHVTHDLSAAWLAWLRETQLPAMSATGLFAGIRTFRLLEQDESAGLTYAVQYILADLDAFQQFETAYPGLNQGAVPERFFPRCMAFQTILEEIS